MNYLSLTFAAFVVVAVLLYYLLPKNFRWTVLLASSVVFYGLFEIKYMLFLLFASVGTYVTALCMNKCSKKKLVFTLCVVLNVAVWFYVKELNWALGLLGKLAQMVGVSITMPQLPMIVPVGISYFVLQAIGYLVDVYRGRISPEKNFAKYLLFLSWFPAIVQGPISRYDNLMPQLLNKDKPSYDKMRSALVMVLFGVVKKMVIADRIAILVNHCFSNYSELHGMILYIGAVGYAIQLYADFSGCVDICRGVSRLFGVELVNNFNRPYASHSIKEFWGRWHMSFSSWLKDYVYIPLGGNRKGKIRKYINLVITFFVSGIWHGTGFNFFVWGMLHAVYQVVGAVTAPVRNKLKKFLEIKEGSFSERFYQVFITFNLTTFAWIFFRADGFKVAVAYIKNMCDGFNLWTLFDGSQLFSCGLSRNAFTLVLVNVVVMFIIEYVKKNQEDSVSSLLNTHLFLRWGIYLLLIFDVLLFGVYGTGYDMAGFLYGGF